MKQRFKYIVTQKIRNHDRDFIVMLCTDDLGLVGPPFECLYLDSFSHVLVIKFYFIFFIITRKKKSKSQEGEKVDEAI